MFEALEISSSGLSAQRKKMNAVASNIANVETTRTPNGGYYKKKKVVFSHMKNKTSFAASIKGEALKLARTHSKHLGASNRKSSEQTEFSKVSASEVIDRAQGPKWVYDPSHPDADQEGYVAMPNINIITEMVDMMTATRAYEANVTAVEASKNMATKALEI